MSTTTINFKTTLVIGEEQVPLASEIVLGDGNSQDGVDKGFLFKLDREPFDPPVTIYLGDVINFINTKLGGGDVSTNPGMALISQAFPGMSPANFNSSNQTLVNIYEFSLNSTTKEFLFSFNLDVENSNPDVGLIALPPVLSNWLKIESLAISFSATSQS
ncbi:hypothetical protein [Undibacterium sp. TS12]|uniref:hypothetical protein n=1 Tax=Undibacterium sp. TS12 TaxID=2908202 RepID=UPI001F4CF514|nr:hypothetical protein [Undibacterium sp. TS12]MCH8620966.1 hypothetical protein [Undibacterium sp. TS12]